MCPCTVGKWCCLRHSKDVCQCEENRHILFYRSAKRAGTSHVNAAVCETIMESERQVKFQASD